MLGDGHCDEECDNSECDGDGHDCECAPGCRYQELVTCKDECMVPQCGFSRMPGYASCSEFQSTVEIYNAIFVFSDTNYFLFRLFDFEACSWCLVVQPSTYCIDGSQCFSEFCFGTFNECEVTEECEALSASWNGPACLRCKEGLVNDYGHCRESCSPGLGLYPLLGNQCFPVEDSTPEHPDVFYVNDNGEYADFGQRLSFSSLSEALISMKKHHMRILLSDQHFFTVQQPSRFLLNVNYTFGRPAPSFEDHTLNITLVPACTDCRATVRLDSDPPQFALDADAFGGSFCLATPRGVFLIERVDFTMDSEATSHLSAFFIFGYWKVVFMHVSFRGIRGYDSIFYLYTTSNLTMIDVSFESVTVSENVVKMHYYQCDQTRQNSGELSYTNGTISVVRAKNFLRLIDVISATLSGLTVQFVEMTDFLSATTILQVVLSDCRFLYNRFSGGAALHVYPVDYSFLVSYYQHFFHFGDPTKADFLVANSEFRGNEAAHCLSFDFGPLPQSVRVAGCEFHDERQTVLAVDKESPVEWSDIYGVGRYENGVRRNANPIFVDLRDLRLQNCTAPFNLFSVSNFPHVSASDITVAGSPETEECATTFVFLKCFNVSISFVILSDIHCNRGCLFLNSSATTGVLSVASALITESSGEVLLSISTAETVSFDKLTIAYSSALRFIEITAASDLAMQFCVFEGTTASEAALVCGAAMCEVAESRFAGNQVGTGGVVQLSASETRATRLIIHDSTFLHNRVERAVVLVQSLAEFQPSQLVLQHLNFTSNVAVTAVVLTSARTVLADDSMVQDCVFLHNTAGEGMVGLHYEQGALSISQSQFAGNEGDAVNFVHSSMSVAPLLHIHSAEFIGNTGSAVYIGNSLSGTVLWASYSVFVDCLSTSLVLQHAQSTVSSCTFENNTAVAGGALMLSQLSTVQCFNCTFARNSAASAGGSVVVFENSQLICENCTFAGNSAGTTGGAISISPGAAVALLHCLFGGNSAVAGSALYLLMSAPSVAVHCEFRRNRAADEATVAMYFSSLALRNCTLTENHASGKSPGVVMSLSNLTIEASTFFSLQGTTGTVLHATMRNSVNITASEFRDIESQRGTIFVDDTVIDISHSTFQSMSADSGSVIVSSGHSRLVFSGNTVKSQSNNREGALYVQQSTCTVSNTRFSALNGSAVYSQGASIAVDQSRFYSNRHADITAREGGGMYCEDCESVKVTRSDFIGLRVMRGAGVFLSSSSPMELFSVESSTFQDNFAVESGGIHADTVNLRIEQCTFINNEAEGQAGAVSLQCADTCIQSVQSCRFLVNKAGSHGGAISWQSGTPNFVANQYEGNTAPYGPDVSSFPTSLFLANSSFPAIASGQLFPSVLTVEVRDHYNQTVLIDNSTSAELSILKGEVFGSVKAIASRGLLTFTGFSLVGKANTTIHIFSAKLQSKLAIDVSFRDCVMGEFASKGLCVICRPGTYSVDPAQPCTECDKHADCLGSYFLTPRPGYWRPSAHSARLYECPNPGACLGPPALTGTCATGYTGNMCQTCTVNYVRYTKTYCQPCPPHTSIVLLTVGLAVCAVLFSVALVVMSIKSAYKEKSQFSLSLKVLTNYVQLVMLMGTFNMSWPTMAKRLLSMQDSAGGFSEQILAPGCLRSEYDENDDFYWKVVAMAFVPLAVFSLSSVTWALWALLRRQASILRNELVGSATILFFLVHPSVIRVMFSALNCEEVDGEYWVVGLKIQCWQGDHWKHAVAAALPSILLWGVGVPALLLLSMSRYRNQLRDLQVRVRFGYLFNGYDPGKYYWEFIVIYRKMLVISLAVFLSRLPQVVPALATLGVLVLSLSLQEAHKPFRLPSFNALEQRSLLVSFVTLFCGLFYLFGGLGTVAETLFFAMMIGVNVHFLQYWVRTSFKTLAAKVVSGLSCLRRFFVVLGEDRVVTHRQHRSIQESALKTRIPLQSLQKTLYFNKISAQLA